MERNKMRINVLSAVLLYSMAAVSAITYPNVWNQFRPWIGTANTGQTVQIPQPPYPPSGWRPAGPVFTLPPKQESTTATPPTESSAPPEPAPTPPPITLVVPTEDPEPEATSPATPTVTPKLVTPALAYAYGFPARSYGFPVINFAFTTPSSSLAPILTTTLAPLPTEEITEAPTTTEAPVVETEAPTTTAPTKSVQILGDNDLYYIVLPNKSVAPLPFRTLQELQNSGYQMAFQLGSAGANPYLFLQTNRSSPTDKWKCRRYDSADVWSIVPSRRGAGDKLGLKRCIYTEDDIIVT